MKMEIAVLALEKGLRVHTAVKSPPLSLCAKALMEAQGSCNVLNKLST